MECEQPTAKNKAPISITSYIISLFNVYFDTAPKEKPKSNKQHTLIKNGGLMPHSPTRKLDAYITPQTVTAPIAIVDDEKHDSDCCDYLSKSDSSTISSCSSFSSVSCQSHHRQRRSVSSLSEILCDHYVQKALNNKNHEADRASNGGVPLETYKVFEASRRGHSSSSNTGSFQIPDVDDDDDSWFIWDNMQETKEWIQVVDEEVFLPKEEVTAEITLVEQPYNNKKVRSIRANPAHLRMIVLEVNMMRCDKIVGPLKSRGFLPARTDTFISNQSSPLKLPIS